MKEGWKVQTEQRSDWKNILRLIIWLMKRAWANPSSFNISIHTSFCCLTDTLKIASCPPDDQQTTFYLHVAHRHNTHTHTQSKHPAVPLHRFSWNSGWWCVIVSLPDTKGTFPSQKPRQGLTWTGGQQHAGEKGGGSRPELIGSSPRNLQQPQQTTAFDHLLKFGTKLVHFFCR